MSYANRIGGGMKTRRRMARRVRRMGRSLKRAQSRAKKTGRAY